MALKDTLRSIMDRLFPPAPDPARTTESLPPASPYGPPALARYVEDRTRLEQTRAARYNDFERIDEEMPEAAAALSIFADNAAYADREPSETFAFETEDERLKETLEEIAARVGARENVWTLARDVTKYGEEFQELIFDQGKDLVRVKSLDRFQTFRAEDPYGRLPAKGAFWQGRAEADKPEVEFEDWQVVHYRLRRTARSRYGTSLLHSARKTFRRLDMMEDGLVFTRLTRAVQRTAFLVDTGGLRGPEAAAHLERVRDAFKKRRYIDTRTGQLAVQDNPALAEDDIWLPQGEGAKSDAKVLQGDSNLGKIEDIEYFRNKFFAALVVPKAYLGLEQDTRARAVMTELDVQFARSVRRIQKALAAGDKEKFDRALAAKGVTGADYRVVYPPISTIDELREWGVERLKAEIAKIWGKDINEVSAAFLLRKYLGLTDEEVARMGLEPKPAAPFSFGGFGGGGPPPAGEEAYAQARLASALETLRELADWEADGERWARAAEPPRRGRRLFVPVSGNGAAADGAG